MKKKEDWEKQYQRVHALFFLAMFLFVIVFIYMMKG